MKRKNEVEEAEGGEMRELRETNEENEVEDEGWRRKRERDSRMISRRRR